MGKIVVDRQLVFEFGDNPRVYWDWWIDPSSPASLVLQEFRHLNLRHDAYFLRDYHQWEIWPICYPYWSPEFDVWDYFHSEDTSAHGMKPWQERADLAAKRHARRARKKYPDYFHHSDDEDSIIFAGPALPGSWVDDDE